MIKISVLIFIAILLSGCATKGENSLTQFPHYNKDKVNLYFVNNEKPLGHKHNFKYKLFSENDTQETLLCFGQYSYKELDEGKYKLEVIKAEFNIFGNRTDHTPFETYLKNGEIYVLKVDTIIDLKDILKRVSLIGSIDVLMKIKPITHQEGLSELGKGKYFIENELLIRKYPLRAEDNHLKTCLQMLLYRI